jgi:regulatory protein
MYKMKEISEHDALFKLSAMCSSAEHCSYEMIEKMRKWGMAEEVQSRLMQQLTKEKYIDDSRYCRFFVRDKIRYNKWGRMKIEQALWQKHISKEISGPVFDAIDDDEYVKVLRQLIAAKRKSVKAESDFERNGKLIKFAIGRGFGMDIVRRCMNTEGVSVDEDDITFLE